MFRRISNPIGILVLMSADQLCCASDITELVHEIWPPCWFLTQKVVFQSADLISFHLEYSRFSYNYLLTSFQEGM